MSYQTLEPMGAFFDARLPIYDTHQMTAIASAAEFYPYTASLLPDLPGCALLDLGCGTGLELEPFFLRNPSAHVTGIDLAPRMLQKLREKFPGKALTLHCASYFEQPFGRDCFDAVVSVESLHHFTAEEKLILFRKVRDALKPGGYLILTDYFSASDQEEQKLQKQLEEIRSEQQLPKDTLFHFDTPLTAAHELETLRAAGFSEVKLLRHWETTGCIFVGKESVKNEHHYL